MVLGRREGRKGWEWGKGGKYKLEARTMDNGYALKSLMVDTRREAFLLAGSLGKCMVFFGVGRLVGSREVLWKADRHLGRSHSAGRRASVRKARGHVLANILDESPDLWSSKRRLNGF